MEKVTKLVLPVAGLGKRLMPLTLSTPKALVEVAGKPLLEYVLEETRGTDIREIILVIGKEQREKFEAYVEKAKSKFPGLVFNICIQDIPLGTGHVLLAAAPLIGEGSFLMRFCDDILLGSEKPVLISLLEIYRKIGKPILTLRRIHKDKVSRFGVVDVMEGEEKEGLEGVYRVLGVTEKPKAEEAPSNLILVGAYLLDFGIIKQMREFERLSCGSEELDCLPITDGFEGQIKSGDEIYGWEFKGDYLDCGTVESLREAEKAILDSDR